MIPDGSPKAFKLIGVWINSTDYSTRLVSCSMTSGGDYGAYKNNPDIGGLTAVFFFPNGVSVPANFTTNRLVEVKMNLNPTGTASWYPFYQVY